MFTENNPGISYGFRISEDEVDLIEEAEKGKDSWMTTKVYERYQSHQPEYDDVVTPNPHIDHSSRKPKHSNTTVNKGNKFKISRSNKQTLERSTFHRDIFSGNYGLIQINSGNPENTVDIDGIQNEASLPNWRRSRNRSQASVNTHSGKPPVLESKNKKANKIISRKGTTIYFIK